MSTQSPTPPTPKGSRNNRRNQKRNTTPYTQKDGLLTTPPSSPPRNLSPGGTATDSSINANLSQKKNVRSNKKPRDAPKASPAQNIGHRHSSSQSNITTPQFKDSPHYAGPTFHASPAPSALPIPSFFSKSLPESDIAQEIESDNFEPGPDLESTPSKPKPRLQSPPEEPQSTPLDFLFKAAVEARNSQPQRSPEANYKVRSPHTDSKTLQQRKLNGVSGGIFPMEMESPEPYHSQIGPSFAPSYRDRMNALRSASSPSPPTAELEEDQRRAKTEALKSLLLNPRPQRPSSTSPLAYNQPNGLGERPSANLNVPHFATPLRTSSGPPAPISHGFPHGNGLQSPFSHAQSSSPQQFRSQNSALRKEVFSSNSGSNPGSTAGTPERAYSPSGAYDSATYSHGYAQQPMYYSPGHQPSPKSRNLPANTPSPALDTKKMEDDLRRILKLDVNPSFPSNGIQSSFA